MTRMNWNKTNSSFALNESHLQHSNQTRDIVDSQLKTVMSDIFGSIAALSFVGNFLLFLVMCRLRKLLSKTYNILMFNLAITDMLTGLKNLFTFTGQFISVFSVLLVNLVYPFSPTRKQIYGKLKAKQYTF